MADIRPFPAIRPAKGKEEIIAALPYDVYSRAEAREAVKGLESAQGLIKREISGVLGIKKAPELRFIADDSSEYSARISRMLKELNLPGEDTVDPEPDSDTEEQDA